MEFQTGNFVTATTANGAEVTGALTVINPNQRYDGQGIMVVHSSQHPDGVEVEDKTSIRALSDRELLWHLATEVLALTAEVKTLQTGYEAELRALRGRVSQQGYGYVSGIGLR